MKKLSVSSPDQSYLRFFNTSHPFTIVGGNLGNLTYSHFICVEVDGVLTPFTTRSLNTKENVRLNVHGGARAEVGAANEGQDAHAIFTILEF